MHLIQPLSISQLDLTHAMVDVEPEINVGGVTEAAFRSLGCLLAISDDVFNGDGEIQARQVALDETRPVESQNLRLSSPDTDDAGDFTIRNYDGGLLENEIGGIVVANAAVGIPRADPEASVDFDRLKKRGRGGCGASSLPDRAVDEPSMTRLVCAEERGRRSSPSVANSGTDKTKIETGCQSRFEEKTLFSAYVLHTAPQDPSSLILPSASYKAAGCSATTFFITSSSLLALNFPSPNNCFSANTSFESSAYLRRASSTDMRRRPSMSTTILHKVHMSVRVKSQCDVLRRTLPCSSHQ